MASPVRNIASRYLESINDDSPSTRLPLQPTSKFNSSPLKSPSKKTHEEEFEKLAKEMNVDSSPSKTALLRTRFESHSATVSSFKSPGKGNSNSSSVNGLPKKNDEPKDETPSWAKANYKDVLKHSPKKGLATKTPTTTSKNLNDALKTPANKPTESPLKLNTPGTSNFLSSNLSSTISEKTKLAPTTPKTQRTRPRSVFLSPTNSGSTDSPGYEYLCRILAIKNWLEPVLQEEIPQLAVELISYIRNGIHLAKLANVILPSKRNVFTNDGKLQFRHTENINRFFQLLDYMNVPDLFRFELTDLYDAKSVPKVWFCLHAMSYMLARLDSRFGLIQNLVDQVDFPEEDIRAANRALMGTGLPNFTSADNGEPAPQETPSYFKGLATPQTQATNQLPGRDVAISKVSSPKRAMVDACVETELRSSITFEKSTSPVRPIITDRLQQAELPAITVEESDSTAPVNRYERFLKETNSTHVEFEACTDYRESPFYTPEVEDYISNIIKTQALAKGATFRYRMFVDRILLRSYADEFTAFNSIIRGQASRRKTIHRHHDDLLIFLDDIIMLQAAARRRLLQKKSAVDLSTSQDAIIRLQSVIRAQNKRRHVVSLKDDLTTRELSVVGLQCVCRRHNIYKRSSVVLQNIDDIHESVLGLQSAARRVLYHRLTNNTIISNLEDGGGVVQLQALIRANRVRNAALKQLRVVHREVAAISELQSIARGGISRTKLCNNVLITLMGEDEMLNDLFAKARGNSVRRQVAFKKLVLEHVAQDEIVPIQSVFRGILSRFEREIKLDDIYTEINSVIGFQSILRGTLVRNRMVRMLNYYITNVDRVIRAQAIIKSKFTHRAYKSLLSMKNPPLSVIKRFAYLLTDNDIDYQEEMELSELKDKIIEKSKTNEDLEMQIENLDIKLSLLDKNKITVEDFIKHKNKYKVYKPNVTAGLKNLERLNKSSRERVELYQLMFYFLQTKPSYFVRLFATLQIGETADLQELICLLYPIKNLSMDHHSREEYFYVKFIFALMKHDVTHNSRNISDLTKAQSSFWVDFFLQFNGHTYQRQHLKSFMNKAVLQVIENEELNFESDPSIINDLIADREVKVHGSTDRHRNLPPQLAIKDAEVSTAFVENLLSLRECATSVLEILQTSVNKIPVHVRLIAKEAFSLSQIQFPEKSEQHHLAVAGVIFIKHYVSAIFHYPENFGLLKDPAFDNPHARSNLKHLSRVVLQVFSMKAFSDNFLKPLNDYVVGSVDTTRTLIKSIIDIKDIELEYELNDYDDIITHERPKLLMKVSDMISLEKLVARNVDIMAPSADDQLYDLSSQLEELVNSAEDLMSLTELGTVTLNLNPTTKEDSLADSKARSLFTQAKRCVLYITRIQDGDGLLELLISRIREEHELKFREMVAAERREPDVKERRRPYHRTSLGDLTQISFRDLKKMALEIIIQLENMGQLTRENSYQEILNQIAVDIKTKDAQRISRKSQLEIASSTINKLLEKERFLSKQLSDYNKHIEGILSQLQSKPKDKKIFNIIPVFSKQYFYHRELRKHKRLPKFGSYIYSVKKLLDQKIVLDFGGLVGHKAASSSKLDFMFSCHEVGKFVIEAASGSVNIPGAFNTISLDQLLNYQYENKAELEMFSGMVKFDTQNLTAFIFRRFYDLKKD